ncbi:pyrroloquinoline quinone-dependent dehydrogenase [Deinococcus pimensis]|uniref:pyrroloquinoline quinone-dependent dehydrogenase n=1 Tax=Deinococcus pimensis TaxID=309888 RepID=UPI000694643C|nr:PQQ-binding-like beta-propeller repeat protein [Deinococcus pimensis]
MTRFRLAHVTSLLALSALGPASHGWTAQVQTVGPTQQELNASASREGDWLMYNKDYLGQRFSTLRQITPQNAARLTPVCQYHTGEVGSFQPGPVVYQGRMIITTPHSTYALSATTCKTLWTHTYTPTNLEPFPANRGVAIMQGRVYRGTTDGHLLALDAQSGKLVWDVKVADSSQGYFLSAAPIAWNGKVFIGEAGADWGAKGHLYAFDARTGRKIWTFDVIPTGTQEGADTWDKPTTAAHGGGSMWTSFTLDPMKKQLYVSVGNPAPDFAASYRPGRNLFTNSLVVLNADSGKLAWYAQQVQSDYHDWDTSAAPTVYDAGGRGYVAVPSKSGYLYLYDRASRALMHKVKVTTVENESAPLTTEGTRFCPGTLGGVEWNGAAFDPAGGTLFVNSVDWCSTLQLGQVRYVAGSIYTGSLNGFGAYDPIEKAKGWVHAVNARTGSVKWKVQMPTPMVAAVTPTAGGVIFTGDLNGDFLTLDARTGKTLYRFPTGAAIGGGVVTYEVGGKQYVAVAAGNASRTLWRTTGAATVVIFALDGGR